jgi:predicted MFS family arabinose efflux permease
LSVNRAPLAAPRGAERPFLFTLVGIGAASTAAHLGNNFTTYLVGGLMDRYGYSPFAMGAWSMAETLSYAAAMFLIAPRARQLDARVLAIAASLLVMVSQAGSALTGDYALLFAGRIGTGLGFGILNAAVNLAAGRTGHPARWISLGIAFQTVLFAGIALGLPQLGASYGAAGMFYGLAGLSLVLGLMTLFLPGGADPALNEATAQPNAPIGKDGLRILAAMALFAFGTLAIWPFIERTAHAIGIPATEFGRYQSMATLASALGNAVLAAITARLPRALPLALVLGACGLTCALLTTVGTAPAFAAAFIGYYVTWFLTYPMLLGLAYDCDSSGRLAVMTTGTWLLAQSLGSVVAGAIAQQFGGYRPIGPLGALTCVVAIAVAWPLARRFDRQSPNDGSRGVAAGH